MGNASPGSLNSLDEGLRVRHIANFPLITCKPQDDAESLFSRPDYEDLDQLPVEDENRIVGIVERSNPKFGGRLMIRCSSRRTILFRSSSARFISSRIGSSLTALR